MLKKIYIRPVIDIESYDMDDQMLVGSGGDDPDHYIPTEPGEPVGAKTFNFVGMSSDDDNNGNGL